MNTSENRTEEIADLLTAAVPEIFETMLGMEMYPSAPIPRITSPVPTLNAAVGFVGEVNGMVHLRVESNFAGAMAARFLGVPQDELTLEMVEDATGEVGNMIVGAVKSRLCDEGSPCVLTIPVVRHEDSPASQDEAIGYSLMEFRGSEGSIALELRIGNPA